MEGPFIRVEESGEVFQLRLDVTTVGRGNAVDVRLTDPSVSRLHAEVVRRGPYAYVVDLGLSRNGTRVNGRPVARRVLEDGDVVSFGAARCRIGGIAHEDITPDVELRRSATPELTRRELDVLTSLCRPALSDEAFVSPATAREIAADLVVTEAAVKQHLLRLYQKFRIPEGPNRRTRLANEVVALGLVRPLPPAGGKPEPARPGTDGPGAAGPSPGSPGQPPSGAQGASPQGGGSRGAGSQGGGSRSPASADAVPARRVPRGAGSRGDRPQRAGADDDGSARETRHAARRAVPDLPGTAPEPKADPVPVSPAGLPPRAPRATGRRSHVSRRRAS